MFLLKPEFLGCLDLFRSETPTHLMVVFMNNAVFSQMLRKCALLPDGYGHGKQAEETNI